MNPSSSRSIRAPHLPLAGKAHALITAAGTSTRFGGSKKEFERLGDATVLEKAVEPFLAICDSLVITCPKGARDEFSSFFASSRLAAPLSSLRGGFSIVEGGSVRQESVLLGLRALGSLLMPSRQAAGELVLIHDAARPWASLDLIQRTLESARERGASLPLMPLTETPKAVDPTTVVGHPPRHSMMTAQTPQIFSFPEILEAHERAAREHFDATDDAMIWDLYVGPVAWVEGTRENRKVTFKDDLVKQTEFRTGQGYDIHPLVEGRRLLLAGVEVESARGEAGYSDGDVLWHAIIDAMLGASAQGDIGTHFPPGTPQWKDADSTDLALKAAAVVAAQGWKCVNLDCTVICERPKLAPYRDRIRAAIASALALPLDAVSFKAKTKEGFDATGRGEAIEALASVLLNH